MPRTAAASGTGRPGRADSDIALCRGLACPQEPLPTGALRELLVQRAQACLRLLLERAGPTLRDRGTGLGDVVRHWTARDGDVDVAWHITQGRVFRALRREDPERGLVALADVALQLHARGAGGTWRAKFARSARCLFDGWLLPAGDRLEVEAVRDDVRITVSRGRERRRLRFRRRQDTWLGATPARPLVQLTGISIDGRIALMPGASLADDEFPDIREAHRVVAGAQARAVLQRAVEALAAGAPEYEAWIFRGLRHLMVIAGTDARLLSGSGTENPSLAYVSLCSNPAALAESLVHEASHHLLHAATFLGPLQDGSDTRLYFSPVTGRQRPLERILLAYHAFANVILMYRRLVAAGLDVNGYCVRNEAEVLRQVRQLERPLIRSAALTAIGRGLFEPLRDRLR